MDADTNMDVIRQIANLVSDKVSKSYAWIAKQKDDEFEDLFGIGWYGGKELGWQGQFEGFCAVRVNEAAMALTVGGELDPLIARLATEVMGYPPGGEQDLRNRRDHGVKERELLDSEIHRLVTRRLYLATTIAGLDSQLLQLAATKPEAEQSS